MTEPRKSAGGGGRLHRWLGQDLPRWAERTFFEPPAAPAAIEIDSSHVVLAMAGRERRGAAPRITALRVRPLPEGLVRPSVLQPNVADPAALAAEVRALLAGLPAPDAVSLLLPDGAAKIGILELENLPASRRDALELVRFRLKKTIPFRIEDAQVDYQPIVTAPGRVRLLTAVASRAAVQPYVAAVEALGAQAGLVTVSALALAERYPPPGPAADGDALVANVTPHALTLIVFRGGEMLLYRCKALAGPQEAHGEEHRLSARREWQATVAYYQERLEGKGFTRAYARLVGWKPSDLLTAEEAERLEIVSVDGWAPPAPGLVAPAGEGALFAPALAAALRGVQ